MKHRIVSWDLLKVIAIFLVVWGHLMQHLLPLQMHDNPLLMWIYSFHMPLFMALSGFFAQESFYAGSPGRLIASRARRLLIPVASWSVIIFATMFLLDGNLSMAHFKKIVFDALWFLKCLFLCSILGLIAFRPHRHRWLWLAASLIISQTFLIWNVFIMYPCFAFGAVCGWYRNYILDHRFRLVFITGPVFLVLSLWAANSPDFWMRDMGIREALMTGNLSITENAGLLISVIAKRYGQVVIGCLGALFLMCTFLCFEGRIANGRLSRLADFSQYTLGIYTLQIIIVEMLLPRLISFDESHQLIFCYLIAPAMSICVVGGCISINRLINRRNPLLASILFGTKVP